MPDIEELLDDKVAEALSELDALAQRIPGVNSDVTATLAQCIRCINSLEQSIRRVKGMLDRSECTPQEGRIKALNKIAKATGGAQ